MGEAANTAEPTIDGIPSGFFDGQAFTRYYFHRWSLPYHVILKLVTITTTKGVHDSKSNKRQLSATAKMWLHGGLAAKFLYPSFKIEQ